MRHSMRICIALQDIFACTRQPPPSGGFFSHEAKKQCKTALTAAMQKRIIHPSQHTKQRQGERIGGHCGGSLTVRPLRFRSKEKLTAGAHSRRERELTWCYRRAAKHWNVTAPRGDWKSRGNGTDTDQQSTGQRCGGSETGISVSEMSASHSQEWQINRAYQCEPC